LVLAEVRRWSQQRQVLQYQRLVRLWAPLQLQLAQHRPARPLPLAPWMLPWLLALKLQQPRLPPTPRQLPRRSLMQAALQLVAPRHRSPVPCRQ
jgi:hypothetical protein